MKRSVSLLNIVLALSLLVAGCAAPTPTEAPTEEPTEAPGEEPTVEEPPTEEPPLEAELIGTLIPSNLGYEGWNLLLEVPLDPAEFEAEDYVLTEELGSPVAVYGGYLRVWENESQDAIIWCAVFSFESPEDALEAYDSAEANFLDPETHELHNHVFEASTGDVGIRSVTMGNAFFEEEGYTVVVLYEEDEEIHEQETLTSFYPPGLAFSLFQRSHYAVVAGSNTLTISAEVPTESIVWDLAYSIDELILGHSYGFSSEITSLKRSRNPLPGFLSTKMKLSHFTVNVPLGSHVLAAVRRAQTITTTPVDVPILLSTRTPPANGTLSFRIVTITDTKPNGTCDYIVKLYLGGVRGIEYDGDSGFLFIPNYGDMCLAANLETPCGSLSRVSGEIFYFEGGGGAQDFTGGGKTNGRLLAIVKCNKPCRDRWTYTIDAWVRDSDEGDSKDILAGIARIASKVPTKYKAALEALAEVLKKQKGVRVAELPIGNAPDYWLKLAIPSGNDVGGGDASREISLPMPPTPTPPAAGDTYEPNDTFADAYGPLVSGQVYQSYMWDEVDEWDVYWFEAAPGTIEISLTDIPSGTDYDLQLYNASRDRVDSSTGTGDSEQITYEASEGGKYYVAIKRYSGFSSAQPYSLTVTFLD